MPTSGREFDTDIPARMDRLPWSGFHWLIVVALGITWILDGLEVTLVGSLSGAITGDKQVGISEAEIGLAASAYLSGAIIGALGFGHLTDRLGRKKLFLITVAVYAVATTATAASWDFASFALFRFCTGLGIGGEYAAINSAIDELIPARSRGWTDLAINGTFWIGAALGAGASLVVLNPDIVPPEIGWRGAFAIGGVLGFAIMLLRRHVPESPRWLMVHGRVAEAEAVIAEIETRIGVTFTEPAPRIRLKTGETLGLWRVGRAIAKLYPKRLLLGLVLMAAQAFFYNAIFFTYALVLGKFYDVPSGRVGLYMFAFAIGNFFGPLLLGRFFDTVGRRRMITLTYALSGILMALTAILFAKGWLDATQQTGAWTIIFFIASAAASAAYLTVGESFPLEARAIVIALFYAAGTAIGGVAAPALFGALIATGERGTLMWGYLGGAALMLIAAATEAWIGVAAERQSLESVARPLSAAD
ncbi:MAG TPA: MFS transporter [Stellaceae bacterium]|nr:MFS transporter [Stellaceae bacterium]